MNRFLQLIEHIVGQVLTFYTNMFAFNKNIEIILRKVRSKASVNFEEQLLIRELLQIIFNRQNFGSDTCQTTFAAVFLKQSGLEFDNRLAIEEYNSYRNRKALKYRPHLRILIKSLKVLEEDLQSVWPNVEQNIDNSFELTIISSIDENRKQKKKVKYNNTLLRPGIGLQIDTEFYHPLNERSEDIWISLSLRRHQQKYKKYFLSFCRTNKMVSKAICLKDLKRMPLTGHQSRCSTDFFANSSSEIHLKAEVDIRIEFTDDPKQNQKFQSEKLISHMNLLTKLYNRWPTDTIPSQMMALLEMNRQQNGITSEDSYVLEENVLQDIQELSEANKKRKEFFNLINRAPTPQSNDINDDNNNNSNRFVPPIKDNKVFNLLNKTKIKVFSE